MRNKRKILIADFFGTLKARGIPAYVRDLEYLAEGVGVEVRTIRAPVCFRHLSAMLQNILMVAFEQIVMPLIVLYYRPDVVIFPYNSSSILCALSPRCVCVIHDLIPYRKISRKWSVAFIYLWLTTRWHAFLKRSVVGVSPHTVRVLRSVAPFKGLKHFYIPNAFCSILNLDATRRDPTEILDGGDGQQRITLISGHSKNKDFEGALRLIEAFKTKYEASDLGRIAVDVVGFGDGFGYAEKIVEKVVYSKSVRHDIKIYGQLPQTELENMLVRNGFTWAHSRAEGFGRVVVEGRMAGGVVILSKLSVFSAFTDAACVEYKNDDEQSFEAAIFKALDIWNGDIPKYEIQHQLHRQAEHGLLAICESTP